MFPLNQYRSDKATWFALFAIRITGTYEARCMQIQSYPYFYLYNIVFGFMLSLSVLFLLVLFKGYLIREDNTHLWLTNAPTLPFWNRWHTSFFLFWAYLSHTRQQSIVMARFRKARYSSTSINLTSVSIRTSIREVV